MKLVFATGNKGKLKEASEIFKNWEIVSISDFTDNFDVEENGSTFLQNAAIKAEAALKIVKNLPVLSDDSGLVVPALDGAPGIFSARFGGEQGNDFLNRKRLLEKMENIEERGAYFTCSAFLLFPDYKVLSTEGRCYGEIGQKEFGTNGFGYDPIFIAKNHTQTIAEMESSAKNEISHRGIAFRKLEALLSCFQDFSE